jgi:Ca2+-binding RTX toxin-like protein
MRKMRRNALVAVLLGAGTGLYGAGPADAATAFVGPSPAFPDAAVVQYVAGPGEANHITVNQVFPPSGFEITDTGATISVGAGCVSISPNTARCSYPDCAVTFNLGDGADFLSLGSDGPCYGAYRAGAGNDTIVAGNETTSQEYLFGGPGDDTLRGRGGEDVLYGGLGGDTLSGGTSCSNETAGQCLAEIDKVTYATRTNDVIIDTDGVANDGEQFEGDMVGDDFEIIVGGHGSDVLVGTSTSTSFVFDTPYPFGPTLLGGAGNDILRGGRAGNRLSGGSGNDVLRGGRGRDWLSGRTGNDRLGGGRGRDVLRGGQGRDVFFAQDGQVDRVYGGSEHDTARVDVGLDVVRHVETLKS